MVLHLRSLLQIHFTIGNSFLIILVAALCMSLYHCHTIIYYQYYVVVVIGYSVVILLIFDWLKNTFEDEHVSLVM